MRFFLLILASVLYFQNLPTAEAQAVKQRVKITIFDKVTNSKKVINGRIHIGDISGSAAKASISGSNGKTMCSGVGSGGTNVASFTGKCFGIPAVAKFHFQGDFLVGIWKYKGSWMKFKTPLSVDD